MNRNLLSEEVKELSPVFEKLGIKNTRDIKRFVDTKLNKIYDVYQVEKNGKPYILKKLEERRFDKQKYDKYFANHDFAVPMIVENVSVGDEDFVLMELVEDVDARGCNLEDAAAVGRELAHIQSHYLCDGGHTDSAEYYFARYLEKYYEKAKDYFRDFDIVWEKAKRRFYEAPQTLIHDDLLPINVLLGSKHPWIIDWDIAGIYPYFLDIARFAYVSDGDSFYISKAAAEEFVSSYYKGMKTNPGFAVDEKTYKQDVAISALYQYIMFQDYDKSKEEMINTKDFLYLSSIIEYLRQI